MLRGVGFALESGELLHVAGPNGTGKTTLLRVACGLSQPEDGDVLWRGQSIARLGSEYSWDLAYVAHDAGLKGDLTARENLRYAAGLRCTVSDTDVTSALTTLNVAVCAELPTRALSAGQRRRVALARLVIAAVPLWILDEPLTNLDAAGAALVLELIAQHLAAGGMALVAAHGELAVRSGRISRLDLS